MLCFIECLCWESGALNVCIRKNMIIINYLSRLSMELLQNQFYSGLPNGGYRCLYSLITQLSYWFGFSIPKYQYDEKRKPLCYPDITSLKFLWTSRCAGICFWLVWLFLVGWLWSEYHRLRQKMLMVVEIMGISFAVGRFDILAPIMVWGDL